MAIPAFFLLQLIYCTLPEADECDCEFLVLKNSEIDEAITSHKEDLLLLFIDWQKLNIKQTGNILTFADLKTEIEKVLNKHSEVLINLNDVLKELKNLQKSATEEDLYLTSLQKLTTVVNNAINSIKNKAVANKEKLIDDFINIMQGVEVAINKNMKNKFKAIDKDLCKLKDALIMGLEDSLDNKKMRINKFFVNITESMKVVFSNISKDIKNERYESEKEAMSDKEINGLRTTISKELNKIILIEDESINHLLKNVEDLLNCAEENKPYEKDLKNAEEVIEQINKINEIQIKEYVSVKTEITKIIELMEPLSDKPLDKPDNSEEEGMVANPLENETIILRDTIESSGIVKEILNEARNAINTFKKSILDAINKMIKLKLGDEVFDSVIKEALNALNMNTKEMGKASSEIKYLIDYKETKQIIINEFSKTESLVEKGINEQLDITIANIVETIIANVMTDTLKILVEHTLSKSQMLHELHQNTLNHGNAEKLKRIKSKLLLAISEIESS